MSIFNPLLELRRGIDDVIYRPYGPVIAAADTKNTPIDDPVRSDSHAPTGIEYTSSEGGGIEVVDSFGAYEAEYASIRKGVGIMDLPQTSLVELTGDDRLDFLHRMLTQATQDLLPGQARRTFLLNGKGRIEADAIVLHEQDRTYLLVDVYQAPRLADRLEQYLFSEDVEIHNSGQDFFHIALHGPAATTLLRHVCGQMVADLGVMEHCRLTIADQACLCLRRDDTGSPGLHLLMPREGALLVYQALFVALDGHTSDEPLQGRGQPIGWQAYNTARIEAGNPLYQVDFGPNSLPHETNLLAEAVSFTKGCYLGQEIVARMQSLGHPKRVLVGIKMSDDQLPIAASEVFQPDGDTLRPGPVVGAVTSSTVSPMMGGVAIGYAMVKWGLHGMGTRLLVPAEGRLADCHVSEIRFLHL